MNNKSKNVPFTNLKANIYLMLIPVVVLLCTIGLLALYSASTHIDAGFFDKVFGKQVLRMLLGISITVLVFFIQKRLIFDITYVAYGVGLVLLTLPYFLDKSGTGTSRWMSMGGINFQPSELMKVVVVLALARWLSSTRISISDFKVVVIPFLIVLLPMGIVLNQPDLGTSMIYFAIVFPMLFWAGVRIFHIFIILAPLISIMTAFNFYTFFVWVILLIIILFLTKEQVWISIVLGVLNLSLGFVTPFLWNGLKPYQQNRILTLLDVNADPQRPGYQVIQSQVAIGSGGFFGKGIAQGTQTQLKFLPEQHTDFIFSVIGEEYGFIGAIAVLTLFFAFMLICIYSANQLKDKFSALVVIGLGSVIMLHVLINVAMTIGLMPVTGLPLPFLSYGGSFVLTCFLIVGLIMNFSIDRRRW